MQRGVIIIDRPIGLGYCEAARQQGQTYKKRFLHIVSDLLSDYFVGLKMFLKELEHALLGSNRTTVRHLP